LSYGLADSGCIINPIVVHTSNNKLC
jgi:hypothetical protein